MMKKTCIWINIILLLWFFLDMTGVYFENSYLVSRAWKEDGIYFLIYLASFLLFVFYDKVGKFVLSMWLGLWLIAQFFSHEYFSIVGIEGSKNEYFEGSIKLFASNNRYYPDLYHIILHILILLALVFSIRFLLNSRK